ncbi:MAG TPA: 3-deoxy-manno-octulosonate cytidylyltransferase [Gammaproteobacteria bacterium]|nr:3-deoxy-manno-octulosonate cytidylyltransferase [Gammaproteobacteria bacterium]
MPATRFHVVIPARFGSERLPAKPLAMLADKPLVQHVYERAAESGAASITIATDDSRILDACHAFGAEALLTSTAHQSGTDRVAEVAAIKRWNPDDIVVNLQGDEPLMPPALIAQAAHALETAPDAGIATLATPIVERAEFENPNAVKVVCDGHDRALYFSRAPIPFERGAAGHSAPGNEGGLLGLRHIGLYAYRVATLQILTRTPPCPLERVERLEQLRALWLGIGIAVATVEPAPPPGVDTAADLERVEERLTASVST